MKSFTSILATAATIFYMTSSSVVEAQQPFPAPRTAVNGTTGALYAVQQIPSCAYVTSNATTGTPILLNLNAVQNASEALNSTSPSGSLVCYVWDPLRSEAPWSNSSLAWPQAFQPSTHVCTVTNFLCPVASPYACGRQCFNNSQYTCVVDQPGLFGSYLIPAITNCTAGPFTVPPPSNVTAQNYPSIYTEIVPTGSTIAASPTSVPSIPPAAPLSVNATAATTTGAAPPAPVAPLATVPVGPTASSSNPNVPAFQPISGTTPPSPAKNKLLAKLSRFF